MKTYLVAVTAILVSVTGLRAQTISVNISPIDQTPTPMAPTTVAGAPGVATDNWNSLGVSGNGNGYIGGSMSNLLDDTGAVTTASVSAGAIPGENGVWDTDFSSWGWSGGDLTMHTGGLERDAQLSISGVPYSQYDVYVYLGGGSNPGNEAADIALGGTGVDPSDFQAVSYPWNGGDAYLQITSTDPANPGSGNYVEFVENTASSFTVDYTQNMSTNQWNQGITGFQIVDIAAVPEPGTLSMASLGLAGLAFAGVRRRFSF